MMDIMILVVLLAIAHISGYAMGVRNERIMQRDRKRD